MWGERLTTSTGCLETSSEWDVRLEASGEWAERLMTSDEWLTTSG